MKRRASSSRTGRKRLPPSPHRRVNWGSNDDAQAETRDDDRVWPGDPRRRPGACALCAKRHDHVLLYAERDRGRDHERRIAARPAHPSWRPRREEQRREGRGH